VEISTTVKQKFVICISMLCQYQHDTEQGTSAPRLKQENIWKQI